MKKNKDKNNKKKNSWSTYKKKEIFGIEQDNKELI